MDFEVKMMTLNYLILEYFRETGKEKAKAKDLMPFLIKKGFYKKDHRQGLPLRNDLRKLNDHNRLDIIETLKVKKGNSNISWTFVNSKFSK